MSLPDPVQLEIRPVQPGDVAAYYPLRLRALREHPEAFSSAYEEQAGLDLATFARQYIGEPRPDWFTLGAWLDGALVGMLGLFRSSGAKTRHQAEIGRMYVASEARRQGVGWALLQAVIQRARQLPGLEALTLGVMAENAAAIGLYRKAGFEITGRVPKALKIDGRYYDFVRMMLDLNV